MNKQKTGLAMFIAGVLLGVVLGAIATYSVVSAFRQPTMEEVNQTMWKIPGFWFSLWAFGVPVGAILAGVGILMYSGKRASAVGLFGSGTFLALALISFINGPLPHVPVLFGIGGSLILLFYFGILWIHSRTLTSRSDYLRLTGYTFLVTGMWFACGEASRAYFKVLEGPGESPAHVMTYFVLAWLFLFLGHCGGVPLRVENNRAQHPV